MAPDAVRQVCLERQREAGQVVPSSGRYPGIWEAVTLVSRVWKGFLADARSAGFGAMRGSDRGTSSPANSLDAAAE